MENAKEGSDLLFWILVLGLLVFVALSSLAGLADNAMSGVSYRDHAVERHGNDAWKARAANGRSGHRFDCDNGKTYWIGKTADGLFSITVTNQENVEITSFVTSKKNKVLKALNRDNCHNLSSGLWLLSQ